MDKEQTVAAVQDAITHYVDGLITWHEFGHKLAELGGAIVADAHEAGETDDA